MPATRIAIDGLWRCLCPSIDYTVTSHSTRPLFASHSASFRNHRSSKILLLPRCRTQPFHAFPPSRYGGETRLKRREPKKPLEFVNPYVNNTVWEEKRRGSDWKVLENVPTTAIHDNIRLHLTHPGKYKEIATLVHYLISSRGEKPARFHYDALVRANSDAENGSAEVVGHLLQEMKELGINADAGIYHGVLQVLAIHPDYILRNQVMQEMKERWIGLSPEGWHNLVAGLLRDRQLESAMDKLEQMQSDQITVEPWLYDIFLHQLCEAGELDEALSMLKYRFGNSPSGNIHPMMWYYLLDKFSSGFNYEGTKYVWHYAVSPSLINPSDGMCLSILNLAARYADPELATSAVREISSRRTALASYHYEALLEAYVGSNDFETAFRILVIMKKAGIEPDIKTTRPLFLHLSQFVFLPLEAWKVLESMHQDGHVIPVGALNVVLEANVKFDNVESSIDLYKRLHTICVSGPNTETFNILFQPLSKEGSKDMAMFLAAEMRALNVKPDQLTYDRLILVCLQEEDYGDAFLYLREMEKVGLSRGEKWWMRAGTVIAFVRRCVEEKDKRVWGLLQEMSKREYSVTERLRAWVEANWGKQEVSPWKSGF